MNDITDSYRDTIRRYLRQQADPDLDKALAQTLEFLRSVHAPIDETLMKQVVADLRREVEERIRKIKDPYILSRMGGNWYDEARHTGIHWPALSTFLEQRKSWGVEVVGSVSLSSAKIVSKLGNPADSEFDTRGLVVGYVQSGKTANMTAVIARAVDAGYNLVVVLTGLTDKLRHQTQVRLESDLVERNPANWQLLTSPNKYHDDASMESGDYRGRGARKFSKPGPDVALLAVMKKHPKRLQLLADDLRNSPPAVQNTLRMLVIDDEADQASPNAGKEDWNPTITNRRIRELLRTLPTVSYVGYTATPFANVLINPFPVDVKTEDEQSLEDLYPRDFIIALPKPDGYFGTEQIFGRDSADAEDGMDIIREVEPEEARCLSGGDTPIKLKDIPSLREALRWFVIVVAARLARGQEGHASMLVHVSHKIDAHEEVRKLVEPEIEYLSRSFEDPSLIEELRNIWNREVDAVDPELFGNQPLAFEDVLAEFPRTIARLQIAVENSRSEDRLDYEGEPIAVIAIGGNILSRGLTLDGLAVTYFARRPRQYDTLLQMGRWFGYREGYEDLVRLWMPERVRENFRQLAMVEYELREEIAEYAQRNARPIDFAVRIRTLPGLQVTARNKMRHASLARIDYRGLHLQTIRFDRLDRERLAGNWSAGSRLVEAAGITPGNLVGECGLENIVKFFRDYSVHPSHRDLSSDWIERYIMTNSDQLQNWTVGVVQPGGDAAVAEIPMGMFKPKVMRRSRLKGTDEHLADIKALMSRADVLLDVPADQLPTESGWRNWSWSRMKKWREDQIGARPMLLLYPIDRISEPTGKSGRHGLRVPLDAVHDVLGVGLVFPLFGVKPGSSPTRYIQVDLKHGSFDDLDEDPTEVEES
jgi:hypothetical protein